MRGALLKLPGVARVDIVQDKREFTVAYDDRTAKPADFLPALKKAGHPAKVAAG